MCDVIDFASHTMLSLQLSNETVSVVIFWSCTVKTNVEYTFSNSSCGITCVVYFAILTFRYVGVFHVLQLLLVTFAQQNLCCISKSMMKHLWKLDKKIEPLLIWLWLFEVYVVDFFTRYNSPPNYIHCWVQCSYYYWRCSPTYLKCVSLWCLLLIHTEPRTNQI